MKIKWGNFTRPDGTSYRQIEVSDKSDWGLFNSLAEELKERLRGRWTEQLDGPDQRYWDLGANSGKITLHLEHYLGITVYPTDGAEAEPQSLALLEDAFKIIENFESS